ncbi:MULTISPECIES: ASCH domain-containing protein [Bradyrhizobium]|uniref:ASCH domain-containing protein n=1 Tax=Bradyrhizobium TaxID=374 RepID=UPI0009B63E67|nr:ASCH domain-containing protein [Bradyrhizobium liaoningense]
MTDTFADSAPALSVRQPWADLIVSGQKSLEIREWADSYRGLLWIHASGTVDEAAAKHFRLGPLFAGGLIGQVELVDIMPLNPARWETWRSRHKVPGPMSFGAVAFVLENPRRLKQPIPFKGRLKLFPVPVSAVWGAEFTEHR